MNGIMFIWCSLDAAKGLGCRDLSENFRWLGRLVQDFFLWHGHLVQDFFLRHGHLVQDFFWWLGRPVQDSLAGIRRGSMLHSFTKNPCDPNPLRQDAAKENASSH